MTLSKSPRRAGLDTLLLRKLYRYYVTMIFTISSITLRSVLAFARRHRPGGPNRVRDATFYWDRRYSSGGNSGSGSYGRLALYKAGYLNKFVSEKSIETVIDLGCGDGHQLSLASYPNYQGFDVSPEAIRLCNERFAADPTKTFGLLNFTDAAPHTQPADLALSLDVIYHILDDKTYDRYMRLLFGVSNRYIVIYSSDGISNSGASHIYHRDFVDWIRLNAGDWKLIDEPVHPFPYDPRDPDNTTFARFFVFEKDSVAQI